MSNNSINTHEKQQNSLQSKQQSQSDVIKENILELLNVDSEGYTSMSQTFTINEPAKSLLSFSIPNKYRNYMYEPMRSFIIDHNTAPAAILKVENKNDFSLLDLFDKPKLPKLTNEDIHQDYQFIKGKWNIKMLPITYHTPLSTFYIGYTENKGKTFYFFVDEFHICVIKDNITPEELIEKYKSEGNEYWPFFCIKN